MTLYNVMSGTDKHKTLETTRTSKRAAQQDVELINTICRRRAWIEESQKQV